MSVQIILKNSSVEDKRPTANQLANGEVSLNYDVAGAFLCCKDDAGNIQQVGGIKISEDAPGTPVKGTLWLQPSTSTLYVHNGTSWLSIAGGGGGGGGVAGVAQIIGADGIDVAPAGGTGIVTVNADIDTDRGLEFVAGEIAVNLGAGLTFNSTTGAIDATSQALSYKGTVNLTADAAVPASPAVGDTYANVGPANTAMNAVWLTGTGIANPPGQTTNPGDLVAWNGTTWTYIPTGSPGGGGVTNLTYTPTAGGTASQGGTVVSSTGTNADIPMVGNTQAGVIGGAAQAGLMHPDDKTKLDSITVADIGTVTSITPGAGLRNDATAGLNATAITDTGTISIGLTAASGLELDPAGTSGGLQVDLEAAGAGTGGLVLDGNEIRVNVGDGIELTATGVAADLEAAGAGTGGLAFDNGEIRVNAGNGIELTATGVAADLEAAGAGTGGLAFDNGEIRVDADTDRGVSLTADGVGVNITANQGLQFNAGTGALEINQNQIGAPDGDSAFGYWDRDSGTTTLSPRTAGDDITTTGDLSAATGKFSGALNAAGRIQNIVADTTTSLLDLRSATGGANTRKFHVASDGAMSLGGTNAITAPNALINADGSATFSSGNISLNATGTASFKRSGETIAITPAWNGSGATDMIHSSGNGDFRVRSGAFNGVDLPPDGNDWVAGSDERSKRNLEPISDGLNKVSQLRAVTGQYLTDKEGVSRSFLVAQDVQKVLPQAVYGTEDNLKLGYTAVIPLLVSALHDAKDRIEALEAEVQSLKGD